MADRDSATRPEREILVHVVVLHEGVGNLICIEDWGNGRVSDGEAADLLRRQHVSLQQRRRYREGISNVVETVGRIVGGKQRFPVDIDSQQVAYHVGIFGSVQAMDGDPAGIGRGLGGAVDFRLQVCGEGVVGGLVRPWHAGGGHLTGSKFSDHLFPHFRAFRNVLDVHRVQHQSCRLQVLVVAGDAVAAENRARGESVALPGVMPLLRIRPKTAAQG